MPRSEISRQPASTMTVAALYAPGSTPHQVKAVRPAACERRSG
jgi:hypothetical protein